MVTVWCKDLKRNVWHRHGGDDAMRDAARTPVRGGPSVPVRAHRSR